MSVVQSYKVRTIKKPQIINSCSHKKVIPDKIKAEYTSNYNIVNLNNIILDKISERMSIQGQEKIKNEIENLKSERQSKKNITYNEYSKYSKKISLLENELKTLTGGEYLNEYKSLTKEIIDEYISKGAHLKVRNVSFLDDNEEAETDPEVLHIINKFLDIAEEYIDIDIIRISSTKKELCINCDYDLEFVQAIGNDNKYCPNCNTENFEISNNNYDKEITKNSGDNVAIQDESVNNFMKSFLRYQGIQTNLPNENIYEELDNYFIETGKPTGKEIRENYPLNKYGYRYNTSPSMLLDVLSKIKRTNFNEYVNFIGKNYWGWKLQNLMHLYDRIKTDYLLTQAAYLRIPVEERGRNSSLGTQFRLRMHLILRGIERPEDEFKIAKNSESMQKQKILWKKMCDECTDPEIRKLAANINF